MSQEDQSKAPTQDDYQQVIEHIAALGVYLEVLAQAAGLSDRDDAWGEQAREQIGRGRCVLLALLYGVKQHCLPAEYFLDYQRMDQITLGLQGRRSIDPDDDLEALIPTAQAIRSILEARSTCDCMPDVARSVVETMEAIRSLAPKPRPN
jgi:hypothetical protein